MTNGDETGLYQQSQKKPENSERQQWFGSPNFVPGYQNEDDKDKPTKSFPFKK